MTFEGQKKICLGLEEGEVRILILMKFSTCSLVRLQTKCLEGILDNLLFHLALEGQDLLFIKVIWEVEEDPKMPECKNNFKGGVYLIS